MKKLKLRIAAVCFLFIAALAVPSAAHAADYDDKKLEQWTQENLNFQLTGGNAGKEVTVLSSGAVNKKFSTLDEYLRSLDMFSVAVSASMDGITDSKLYWSQEKYKDVSGKSAHIAVLKADESSVWTQDSCMIFKVEDIGDSLCGIEVDMGASKDGPRDYKISYSVDNKETWMEFNQYGTDKGTVKTAGHTAKVFQKFTCNLARPYTEKMVQDDYLGNQNVKVFDDIYFKVSVASDYKADGTKGLYGSNKGEWGLKSIRLFEAWVGIDDPPAPPQSLKAYKTADGKITLSWRGSTDASGYEIYLKKGNGKYHKVKDIKSPSTRKYTLKNLSSKGIYKIRMRSYDKIKGAMTYSRYMTVTVDMKKQPLPKNLSVSKSLSLNVGQKKKINVKCTKGTDSRYIKTITYKIKNPKIASVKSSGYITGKKKGNTTVTVKVTLKSGLSKSFTTNLRVGK